MKERKERNAKGEKEKERKTNKLTGVCGRLPMRRSRRWIGCSMYGRVIYFLLLRKHKG